LNYSNTEDAVTGLNQWKMSLGKVCLVGSLLTASVALPAMLTGCSEMVTYSKVSREQGVKLLEAGQVEQAAGAFRNATKQNARDYQSFYYLGQCYEQLGQEQLALYNYKTALQIQPATVDGRLDKTFRAKAVDALGSYVARANSREQELDSLEEQANRTQLGTDWFVLAKAYQYSGDADSASDAYNRATLVAPADIDVIRSYGLYLEEIGQARRADPVLRRAYQLNPSDPQVIAALRKVGVVPGPAILAESQLEKPVVPNGPIPEMQLGSPEQQPTRVTVGAP